MSLKYLPFILKLLCVNCNLCNFCQDIWKELFVDGSNPYLRAGVFYIMTIIIIIIIKKWI